MDDIVKQALKKWPNVPHCYGWLALDARGDWYMRDDRIQHAGPFPQVKGSRIEHEKLREFIERNYAADPAGAWFFQNGPQRVYVELEATPYIWRVQATEGGYVVNAHTGLSAQARQCLVDEFGRVYLETDLGFGLVHSQDVPVAADAIEQGRWSPQDVQSRALPARFAYVRSPGAARRGAHQGP